MERKQICMRSSRRQEEEEEERETREECKMSSRGEEKEEEEEGGGEEERPDAVFLTQTHSELVRETNAADDHWKCPLSLQQPVTTCRRPPLSDWWPFSSLHPFFCWWILTKDTNTPWTPSIHQLLPDSLAAAPPEPNRKHTLSELLFPLRRSFSLHDLAREFLSYTPATTTGAKNRQKDERQPVTQGETSNLCPRHPGLNQARSGRVFWAGHVRQVQRTQTETQLSAVTPEWWEEACYSFRAGRHYKQNALHLILDTKEEKILIWGISQSTSG